MTANGKTKSFTPEQRVEVDKVLSILKIQIETTINTEATRIRLLDSRPKRVYSPQHPNVFFRYVAQGMLEDLIVDLQERV